MDRLSRTLLLLRKESVLLSIKAAAFYSLKREREKKEKKM